MTCFFLHCFFIAASRRRGRFLVHLVEGLRRELEGAEGGRDAAVDRRVHQQLLDLVAAHPGVARCTKVQLQLVHLAHADQHRDRDHAPCLVVEAGAGPDTAPGIFHQEILEFGIERSSVLRGARGMRPPKNGFADLFPALVAFFVHFFLRFAPNSALLGRYGTSPLLMEVPLLQPSLAVWSCPPAREDRLGLALVLASSVQTRFSAAAVQSRPNGPALFRLGWMGNVMPRKIIAALFALVPLLLTSLLLALAPNGAPAQTGAASAEKRIALVIGNAGYQVGALNTPANDAGLIAQTLQAAGFDVVGARDLGQDSLRRAFRDFVEKATGSGPGTVAFVYVSGYGLQLEGENYFVPIDAKIARDSDVPSEALRISDYAKPLAALKLKASIIVLDAARANPFAKSGPALAGGLALVEPEPGTLIAFNAAPGTVAPEGQGPYGPYAQALAEMLREGGMPLAQVFDRTRLRVNDMTKGAQG